MATYSIKSKILDQLEILDTERQKEVLNFARILAMVRPKGMPGNKLLSFAGTIKADDLRKMRQAIEEGCEQVNLNEW
ncbi:MAG: hypothetical protein ACE5IH_06900 [Thermodesulfobacteriota bacterium]